MLAGQGFSDVRSLDGGIDAWHGTVATGGYRQGMEVFAEVRVALDVLPLALALEEGSRAFYAEAGKAVDEGEWQEVFRELVKAEEHHKERLLEASRAMTPPQSGEIPLEGKPAEGRMEGAVRLDEALQWVRSAERTPLEILELAMQVEANSLDLYLKVAGLPQFAPVREVLDVLVGDEKRHLARLGALLEAHLPPAGLREA